MDMTSQHFSPVRDSILKTVIILLVCIFSYKTDSSAVVSTLPGIAYILKMGLSLGLAVVNQNMGILKRHYWVLFFQSP